MQIRNKPELLSEPDSEPDPELEGSGSGSGAKLHFMVFTNILRQDKGRIRHRGSVKMWFLIYIQKFLIDRTDKYKIVLYNEKTMAVPWLWALPGRHLPRCFAQSRMRQTPILKIERLFVSLQKSFVTKKAHLWTCLHQDRRLSGRSGCRCWQVCSAVIQMQPEHSCHLEGSQLGWIPREKVCFVSILYVLSSVAEPDPVFFYKNRWLFNNNIFITLAFSLGGNYSLRSDLDSDPVSDLDSDPVLNPVFFRGRIRIWFFS
jgi:hypothetical protein